MTTPEKDMVYRHMSEALGCDDKVDSRTFERRCVQLAMQWPSLAAALGEWMNANALSVPAPFRRAQRVMEAERNHTTLLEQLRGSRKT